MELEDFIKRYGDTVAIGDMPDTMPKVIRSPDPFAPGTPFEQSSRNFTNQEVQLQKRLETLNSADTSDYNFIQRKTHSMETNRARNALEKLRKNMEEKPGAFANMRERGGTKEQQDRSAQINKIFQRDYGTDDETESSDRQPGLGKANERPVPEEKNNI